MCCLFGLVDYRRSLTVPQKNRLVSALAHAAEIRGTDATGIAYNSGGRLRIYKRPRPAHTMRFCIPRDAAVIMGHTRMTTQGKASRNRNNHPFAGRAGDWHFALAHNGVLFNDRYLRSTLQLPETRIETDSYIAVQLIEQKKTLDFSSLKYMAEQVEGTFTFTVLDQENSLYIVRGDNPLCLVHFPSLGLYVYASTEEILKKALTGAHPTREIPVQEGLTCGDILKISADGKLSRSRFDDSLLLSQCSCWPYGFRGHQSAFRTGTAEAYLESLKAVAPSFGFTPEVIDRMASLGYCAEEIEEFLYDGYCGEVFL